MDGLEGFGPAVLEDLKRATVEYLIGSFRKLNSELLVQVLVDSAGKYVGDRLFFSGKSGYALGRYRDLFDAVWETKAAAFALVHNHPSGRAEPSKSDLIMTRRVAALCKALDIGLIDHFIVSDRSAFSMRRMKIFNSLKPVMAYAD